MIAQLEQFLCIFVSIGRVRVIRVRLIVGRIHRVVAVHIITCVEKIPGQLQGQSKREDSRKKKHAHYILYLAHCCKLTALLYWVPKPIWQVRARFVVRGNKHFNFFFTQTLCLPKELLGIHMCLRGNLNFFFIVQKMIKYDKCTNGNKCQRLKAIQNRSFVQSHHEL